MDIALTTQIIGAVGVIASVLYLALQIRQNTLVARSEALQVMATRVSDRLLMVCSDPELAALINSDWDDENLSGTDKVRIFYWIAAVLTDLKDVHYQYELKIIPEAFLISRTKVLKAGMFQTELGKELWERMKPSCSSAFLAWFETHVLEADSY